MLSELPALVTQDKFYLKNNFLSIEYGIHMLTLICNGPLLLIDFQVRFFGKYYIACGKSWRNKLAAASDLCLYCPSYCYYY